MSSVRAQSPVPLGKTPAPSGKRPVALGGMASKPQVTSGRWRHPFDTATGTVALGILLTIALVLALKLLNG
jgi:hypothetical protein